ncbi:hypothetical protein EVAR_48496_1 [Eumeta japonica]|uniref:Uncharacterized protein n=1 Tax=Eumeta variegata TaxID=151549 RepID=A0A4C1XGL5_EUMVA|nr:hypothetical protein EVAR_48496_1 [Eumeta japonica]
MAAELCGRALARATFDDKQRLRLTPPLLATHPRGDVKQEWYVNAVPCGDRCSGPSLLRNKYTDARERQASVGCRLQVLPTTVAGCHRLGVASSRRINSKLCNLKQQLDWNWIREQIWLRIDNRLKCEVNEIKFQERIVKSEFKSKIGYRSPIIIKNRLINKKMKKVIICLYG